MKIKSRASSPPVAQPRWMTSARMVWLGYALITLSIYVWQIPYRMSQPWVPGWPGWSETQSLKALADLGISLSRLTGINNLLNLLVPLLYMVLAWVIFWKRSSEPTGLWWATFFILFWSSFASLGEQYPSWRLIGDLHASLSSTLLLVALYTFPDARFKPGWTRWAALGMAAIQTWRLFQPGQYEKIIPVLMVGIFLSIPLAQVYRYIRFSNSSQRQQGKWVVFGLAVCTIPLGIFLLFLASTPALQQPTAAGMLAFLIGNSLWIAFACILPLSFFIAILRSGLWDIDLVIRRTLVYSLLSGLLALVYFGSITIMQSLFSTVSGQRSTMILVASTLLIAALFNPLRLRIQDFIDRRFYRRRYDAEKALAQFAAAARRETDLQLLTGSMIDIIQNTLQPEVVSVWFLPETWRAMMKKPEIASTSALGEHGRE